MEKRIRNISLVTFFALLILGIYILYQTYSWLIPFCFIDPSIWQNIMNGELPVQVSALNRLSLFSNWTIYIMAVFIVLARAMQLCLRYYKGEYFSQRIYKLISFLGSGTCLCVALYYVALNLHNWIIFSTIDGRDFQFWTYIDPFILALFIYGLLIFVIGWVMKIATEMKEDNEAII